MTDNSDLHFTTKTCGVSPQRQPKDKAKTRLQKLQNLSIVDLIISTKLHSQYLMFRTKEQKTIVEPYLRRYLSKQLQLSNPRSSVYSAMRFRTLVFTAPELSHQLLYTQLPPYSNFKRQRKGKRESYQFQAINSYNIESKESNHSNTTSKQDLMSSLIGAINCRYCKPQGAKPKAPFPFVRVSGTDTQSPIQNTLVLVATRAYYPVPEK